MTHVVWKVALLSAGLSYKSSQHLVLIHWKLKYGYKSCQRAHNPEVSECRPRGLPLLSLPPIHRCVKTDPWEEPFVGNWAYSILKIPGALQDNKKCAYTEVHISGRSQTALCTDTELCLLNWNREEEKVFYSLTFLWSRHFSSWCLNYSESVALRGVWIGGTIVNSTKEPVITQSALLPPGHASSTLQAC